MTPPSSGVSYWRLMPQNSGPPPADWWALFMVGAATVAVSIIASAARGEEFSPARAFVQMAARWLLAGAIAMAMWALLEQWQDLNQMAGVALATITAIAGTDTLTARLQRIVNLIFDGVENWIGNKLPPDSDAEQEGGEK